MQKRGGSIYSIHVILGEVVNSICNVNSAKIESCCCFFHTTFQFGKKVRHKLRKVDCNSSGSTSFSCNATEYCIPTYTN